MKSTVIQGNTVWGLALQPVEKVSPYTPSALIVSTHRMKRGSKKRRLRKRLQKVIVHEVGHSLSLPHCQHHNTCIMVDVGKPKSSIDQVKTTFCAKCRKQIQPYLKE
jgi:archaemetzincin